MPLLKFDDDLGEREVNEAADEAFERLTGGSPTERRVFEELERRGFTPGVDFIFQADRLGGISHYGNAKIHFIVHDFRLALRVQGFEWPNLPADSHALDQLQKEIWTNKGFFVADLLANEIIDNVRRVVGLALEYRMTAAAESVLR